MVKRELYPRLRVLEQFKDFFREGGGVQPNLPHRPVWKVYLLEVILQRGVSLALTYIMHLPKGAHPCILPLLYPAHLGGQEFGGHNWKWCHSR